jgi:hypothetical protein
MRAWLVVGQRLHVGRLCIYLGFAMGKTFFVAVPLLFVLLVGCAAVERSHAAGDVVVFVDEQGRLLGNGYTLDQSELPMFAKEVGACPLW